LFSKAHVLPGGARVEACGCRSLCDRTTSIVESDFVPTAGTSSIALHENIMVAATVAIGAFVFRPRQLIGYDRLRSQPA
jgi:hypothetical protein